MPPVVLGRHLMGTRFELVLPGTGDEARRQAAGEEALDEIERLDRQLSLYRGDSDVAALNARAGREWVSVEPRLFRLLVKICDLSTATGGAFDPTVLPLLRAWGFIGGRGAWPNEADVEAARLRTGMGHVLLDPDARSVHFDRPGVELDLGAVGKGYAVEVAMEVLSDVGVASALLHGGTSTVAALGAPEDGGAWNVAIVDPDEHAQTVAIVPLTGGQSLSVSGVHGKAFVGPDGRVYGHVLDPREGRPVVGARLSAVVTASATEADALSTALLVLGPEGLDMLAAGWPDAGALVLTDDGMYTRQGGHFAPPAASPGGYS